MDDLPHSLLSGILDSATTAAGLTRQQDCCFHLHLPGCKLVVVADGVGLYQLSTTLAPFAVSSLVSYVQEWVRVAGAPKCSDDALAVLLDAYEWANKDILSFNTGLKDDFGAIAQSTLLAVLEIHDAFVVAGVGDGGVYLSHGNGHIERLPVGRGQADGSTAALGEFEDSQPSWVIVEKNDETGNLLVVCTDGMTLSLHDEDNRKRASGTGLILSHLLEDIRAFYQGYRGTEASYDRRATLFEVSPRRVLESWVISPSEASNRVRTQILGVGPLNLTSKPDNRTLAVISDGLYLDHIMGVES